jgi:hypothetical protein
MRDSDIDPRQSNCRESRYRSSSLSKAVARATLLTGLVAGISVCASAHAADDKKAEREARRAQLLEQRLEEERSEWQAERADLQKKIVESGASLDSLKASAQKSGADLASVAKDRLALQRQVSELSKRLADQQAVAERERTAATSSLEEFTQARVRERVALNAQIQTGADALSACTDRNRRLADLGRELLVQLRAKGVVDIVRQREPVAGFGDVEMFNLLQTDRDRINADQISPAAKSR